MKVFLFLLSLSTFSLASAQNKDLFDVNQHLKKLSEKNKAESKKKILLNPILEKIKNPFSIKIYNSFYLANGDKVMTLRGYNMPCVVPDMNKFQSMPVAGKNFAPKRNEYGAIPNPSAPLYLEELLSGNKIKILK